MVELRAPIVIRLDGTNAEQGRQIILDAGIPPSQLISKPTMLDAARRPSASPTARREGRESRANASERAPASERLSAPAWPGNALGGVMAIFVDADTKVLVQGLTGGQDASTGLRNCEYGTQVVAGVTPGKGGQDVEGIPVFDSVAEAVAATGATPRSSPCPRRPPPAAILEAAAGRHLLRRVHHRRDPGPGRGAPTTCWWAITPALDCSGRTAPW